MTGLIGYAMIAVGVILMCVTPLQGLVLLRPKERIIRVVPPVPQAFPVAPPEPTLEELVALADAALARLGVATDRT